MRPSTIITRGTESGTHRETERRALGNHPSADRRNPWHAGLIAAGSYSPGVPVDPEFSEDVADER